MGLCCWVVKGLKFYWERRRISCAEREKECRVAESDHSIDTKVGRILLFLDMAYNPAR